MLFNHHLGRPVGTATSVGLALETLCIMPVDILFIRLNYWDDWLKAKNGLSSSPAHIVFLSGRSDKCAQHLPRDVDFHLQPPYRLEELTAVFELLVNPYFVARPLDFFFLRVNCRYHLIYFSTLRTIESKDGFITINTTSDSFTVAGGLAQFQKRLPIRLNRAGRSLLIANPF